MGLVTIQKRLLTMTVETNLRTGLARIGANLVDKIKGSMVGGSGRRYKYKGTEHVASAPGMPPSPITWRLHDSITFNTTFGDRSSIGPRAQSGDEINKPPKVADEHTVSVGSNVPYALSMEKGLRIKKVASRPYLWPALKASREMIKEALEF